MTPDELSFGRWAGERQLALLRTAVLLTGDRHRAEVLVQDALTQVAVEWKRLRDGYPDAYAREVIIRDDGRWCNKHRDEVVAPASDDLEGDCGEGADLDRLLVLDQVLGALTPEQRAIVVLRHYDLLPDREIADAIGGKVAIVKDQPHLGLPDLSELLRERVAGVIPVTDLSVMAWRDAAQRRKRRLTTTVAGVAAGVLMIAGVSAVVGLRSGGGPVDRAASAKPDAMMSGVPVFFAPSEAASLNLSPADHGPLPAVIDLAVDAPSVDQAPIGRVLAAFVVGRSDQALLLSPDGYRTGPKSRWFEDGGSAKANPSRTLTARSHANAFRGRAGVVVTRSDESTTVLAVRGSRGCCPVAGWLDDDTVVYESHGAYPALIAWQIGTHDFSLVSRIDGLDPGASYVARFAGLDDRRSLDSAAADADVQGVPLWWSPDVAAESQLPWLAADRSPLPRHLVVPHDADELSGSFGPAIGAFAPGDGRVLLLDHGGSWTSVNVAGRGDAATSMLSTDGRRLLLERGRQYSVLDLATGRWSVFSARLVRLEPPDNGLVGQRVAVGPSRANSAGLAAQAWGPGGLALPLPDPGRQAAGPPYLTVMGGTSKVLAFVTDVARPRALDAPTVAGWLDHDTVVYESRASGQDLLVAWDVGTRRFARVATIAGSATSSFALVDQS